MRDGGKSARGTARGIRDERGTALIEFALILPATVLILFGLMDFGFIYNGYSTMRNGVQAGARLASENTYTYSGSTTCTNSSNPTTAMVCTVASSIGNLYGVVPGSLKVGILLTNLTTGQNVTICASASLNSTSGLLQKLLFGDTMQSSSTLLFAQTTPSYGNFGVGATVTYGGVTIKGLACS